MKYAVVTGASTGIGYGTVGMLADRGFHVFGSVRREEDARRLVEAFGEKVTPLVFDVCDADAVAAAAESVAGRVGGRGLAGLVNNAGIAVTGPLMHVPVDRFRQQLEVNVIGVLQVTQAFLPLLGAVRDAPFQPGRIVNISSVSGRFAFPFVGPYAASKFALEAMSDSLRRELLMYGIDVVVIEPGRIRTPIWEKVEDPGPYDDTDYGPVLRRLVEHMGERLSSALPVEAVTEIVYKALTAARPKLRYAIPDQRVHGWILPRLMPDRLIDRLIRKSMFAD